MKTGRQLRLALSAAILAVLFVFGIVGHAGLHAGSAPSDPPCAMCAAASDALVVFAAEAPAFDAPPQLLESRTDAPLRLHVPILHLSRGPPSRG